MGASSSKVFPSETIDVNCIAEINKNIHAEEAVIEKSRNKITKLVSIKNSTATSETVRFVVAHMNTSAPPYGFTKVLISSYLHRLKNNTKISATITHNIAAIYPEISHAISNELLEQICNSIEAKYIESKISTAKWTECVDIYIQYYPITKVVDVLYDIHRPSS